MIHRACRRGVVLSALAAAACPAAGQWTSLAPNHITATNSGGVGIGVAGDSGMFGKLSVLGNGNAGIGVWARSTAPAGAGLYGESTVITGSGIVGYHGATAPGQAIGVWGITDGQNGVALVGNARNTSGANVGIYASSSSPNGYAGFFSGARTYFQGNVGIESLLPSARLQIGGQPGSARAWMLNGVLVGVDTDSLFIGLKDEGPDRDDAVIAFGDDDDDSLRIIHNAAGGPVNGNERLRVTSAVVGVPGATPIEFGFGVAGKELNAGKITYGGFSGGSLNIVGAGTTNTDRKIRLYSEGGLVVDGHVAVGNDPSELFKVYGYHQTYTGVLGHADGSVPTGVGVRGISNFSTGYAGYFTGRVYVTEDLSCGGTKPFTIDHPLDPANKLLRHYATESPEVLNFYRGVVTLDQRGSAVVALPDYYAAINREPSYLLTAVGAPMPGLHVAREIEGNTFEIAGGVPGMKVSWRIEAVRDDAYVRSRGAPVEVEKSPAERGRYHDPALHGQPESARLLPIPRTPHAARP